MQRLPAPRGGKSFAGGLRGSFLLASLSLQALAIAGVSFVLFLPASVSSAAPSGERISAEGRLQVLIEDDFEQPSSRWVYRLETDEGETISLDLDRVSPDRSWRAGSRIRVEGFFDGETLRADRVEPVTPTEALGTEQVTSSWTTGAKKVLLIRFNFKDDTSMPYSDATATNVMFGASGSVAAFYKETSFGLTTQSGSITPWLTVNMNKPTTCDPFTPSSMADTLAKAKGLDPSKFDFYVYVFPRLPCGWSGLGSVGGPGAWINQALSTYVVAHELGHNYGLLHAHSLRCGTQSIGSSCVRSEYGDPFDTMGGGSRQFNAFHKNQLDWFPNAGSVATISSGNQTFTLSTLESSSGLRAVQIPTSVNRTYWIEYRQASAGFDAGLTANVTGGALVHIGPAPDWGSDLLDMTPATNTFGDAALDVGLSFIDPDASLEITTLSQVGQTLTVQVQFGVVAPTANFNFNPASPIAGHVVTFQDLSTGLPASWQWDFGDGATSTLKSPIHTYPNSGTYTVTLVASNGKGSSTPATKTVTVSADPPLSFYTIAPCRLIDTRSTNPPGLFASFNRSFALTGKCGIPAGAKAISVNITVTGSTKGGDIKVLPVGAPDLGTKTIYFKASQTRANNAVLELGTGGALMTVCEIPSGTVQFILDVDGYFQ